MRLDYLLSGTYLLLVGKAPLPSTRWNISCVAKTRQASGN